MCRAVRLFFAELRDTLRSIPGIRNKLEHLWNYYRLWIIGLGFAAGFGIFMIVRLTTAVKENRIYAVFVNTYADLGEDTDFWNGYIAYTGYDPKEKNIQFDCRAYFDYSDNQGRGNTYYDSFVSFIDAGLLDAAVMEKDSLEAFGATGRLLDLNNARCKNLLEKYGDRLVFSVPLREEYGTGPVPVGVDITDARKIKEYRVYEEDCCLGIGAGSRNIEAVEALLEYLFDETQQPVQ